MALFAKGIQVVVADGEKAMILENVGTTDRPQLRVLARLEQDLDAVRAGVTDRPGRRPDTGPGQRSALEEGDVVRVAKDRFATGVAAEMNRRAADGAARIVLAAPPQTLARLRDALSPAVRARLLGEIDKTLTQHPLDRMAAILTAEIDAF